MNRYRWSKTMHEAYDYLSEHAGGGGQISITMRDLGAEIGRHYSSTFTAMDNLLACGAVEKVGQGGSHRANTYRIVAGL